ncbi:MAG: transglycosylase domain-containing protein [Prevotellaceae bacterium]|jgi:penicillin-binding protein 1A|nr:transglycosylase domain-containing protein [Prevotellaceae bacterium]
MTAKKSNPSSGKYLRIFWLSFIGLLLLITLLFVLIAKGYIGYMPDIEELKNPHNKFATEIYSADNQLLGRYFQSKANRVSVNYNEISPNMINALIATEDARFESHSGIDGMAITRAVVKMGKAGGGSTLSQQLAKLLITIGDNENRRNRIFEKINEWVIAVELERLYTKEEILTMYLNQFDFLHNAVGIKSAAQVYFSTTPDKLKIEEAAMLVGMCKNPSYFNPIRFKDRALERRNVVLNQMRKYDYITRAEYDSLKQTPLTIKYQTVDHKSGLAPYFREYLRMMLTAKEPKRSNYAEWAMQEYSDDSLAWANNPLYGFCEKNRKPDGSQYNIYTDGLKIYTTIDSRMQRYAEEAVDEHIQYLQGRFFEEKKNKKYAPFSRLLTPKQIQASMDKAMRLSERYRLMKENGASEEEITQAFNTKIPMQVFSYKGMKDTILSPMDSIRYQKYFLRCAFMSMSPLNGHVKAYVGGPNFAQFQYDMAGKGRRQVGSTIKPYLYSLAMNEGWTPCDLVPNQPYTFTLPTGQTWTPRNSSKTRMGEMVTLRWGLANSNNWISAYLMGQLAPQALVNLMHSFGITGHIEPVVSLCLGPAEVKLAEMVDAYTVFPNKGMRVDPLYVTRIEDSNGNVIASFIPQIHDVINESTAYKMIYMLQAVITQGTGARVRYRYGLTGEICGKTGTTQNNSDGWFMGFTPSLVSGAWVGGEDRGIHFDSMADGQGAAMALPIWALYMQKVYANPELGYLPSEKFEVPNYFKVIDGCLQELPDSAARDEILD